MDTVRISRKLYFPADEVSRKRNFPTIPQTSTLLFRRSAFYSCLQYITAPLSVHISRSFRINSAFSVIYTRLSVPSYCTFSCDSNLHPDLFFGYSSGGPPGFWELVWLSSVCFSVQVRTIVIYILLLAPSGRKCLTGSIAPSSHPCDLVGVIEGSWCYFMFLLHCIWDFRFVNVHFGTIDNTFHCTV